MIDDRRLLDALLRNDLSSFSRLAARILAPGQPFVWNWHLQAICYALERALRGETRRLLIEIQPRSGKSLIGSVIFPAYALGRNPKLKIVTASYGSDLAVKHAIDSRALMRSDRYRGLFPGTVIGGKDTQSDFHTTARGFRLSTSPGGTLTGRGGDIIILDDIMSARDAGSDTKRDATSAWFSNTLLSRLDDKPKGVMIVINQRLHMQDLAGRLREQGGFEILSLPAIAPEAARVPIGRNRFHDRRAGELLHPEREPKEVLDELLRAMGSYNFSAQYQQQPVPPEGEIVKWRWFKTYRELPRTDNYQIIQSWDIALTNNPDSDYTVCTTWMKVRGEHYLLDLLRIRADFPQLCRIVPDHVRSKNTEIVLIEDATYGKALIQHIRAAKPIAMPPLIGVAPVGDKVTRMATESPIIEAGRIHLPENASWKDALRAELAQFPIGRHDDMVDSLSRYLHYQRSHGGPSIGEVRVR